MAFRAGEAAENGYERTKNYLIPKHFSLEQRNESEEKLLDIVEKCGPVVEGYPTWHPLVYSRDKEHPEKRPNERCGYEGLDHTRYFAHGFITCPYSSDHAQKVIQSVENLTNHHSARIIAERLDISFYAPNAAPVLVRCEWSEPLETLKMIPKKLAVPLMIEHELTYWHRSNYAERWDTMRPYLLGEPHGSRSSLFVDQETALAIKKAYMTMVESGMFGPLKMD